MAARLQWRWTSAPRGHWWGGRFPTRELARQEAERNLVPGARYYTGREADVQAPSVPVSLIVERISDNLYYELGEIADAFAPSEGGVEDLAKRLDRAFRGWWERFRYGEKLWRVTDVEEHVVAIDRRPAP